MHPPRWSPSAYYLVPCAGNTQRVPHVANEPGKPGSTPPNWRGNCRAQHLTTSGSRGLALAAHQIVMLRGLAKHLLHVFGQQILCLY
jgi:hypothetical protein